MTRARTSPLSSLVPLVPASLLAIVVACGGGAPTPPSGPSSLGASSTPGAGASSSDAPPAASVDPAVANDRGDDPAPARKRKPFEIYNACGQIVTVVFGEDAKAQGAGRRTLTASSSVEGPRDDKGNQTVWLLDEKGEPLVKVHVTRGMKRVEVGRSCRTLDAR